MKSKTDIAAANGGREPLRLLQTKRCLGQQWHQFPEFGRGPLPLLGASG
jgi:hypothetical protein